MKKFLLFLFGIIVTMTAFSEPVSMLTARKVAQNYYTLMAEKSGNPVSKQNQFHLALTYTNASFVQIEPAEEVMNLFYVFNVNEKDGFVIISADDKANPILGYSFTGNFTGENLPPALHGMLEQRAEEMKILISDEASAQSSVKSAWTSLLESNTAMNLKSFTAVDPLLSTTWDQAPYYNELCPYDYNYNELTVTGCPATAMAQIMKFWNYPENGTGYHSYNTANYGTLSANFAATTYDWSNMTNSINGSNIAIATLMYHCGVSVEMEYGVAETGGSGGYVIEAQSPITHCCEYAFKTYFGYKNTLQGLFRDNYNDANWIQLLKTELDNSRPIQYAGFGQGGGHTWVCDGYDNDNNFHMNWGWGGTYDAYYTLNDLSPGTGGAGGGSGSFNSGQQALIGIEPAGGGGGSTTYNLEAYSTMVISPNPIQFAEEFEVTLDIANLDDEPFTGSLGALLFNENGDFVDVIEEINGVTLAALTYYTVTFHTDQLLATPGSYNIAITYKDSATWTIINPGDYTNYQAVNIVGPDNTMQMYAPILLDPEEIVTNEAFQITVDILNNGTETYYGLITADLYYADGTYYGELASASVELESGYYLDDLQFNYSGVVNAGTYILAIWNLPNGGDWILVGSDMYPNPITIQIGATPVVADIYENNDDEGTAFLLPLNMSGNQVTLYTEGSTLHVGNDLDYYRIDLPPGSQYKIIPYAYDSYSDEDNYTVDVLWALGAGGEWSDVYDDAMEGYFVVNGGQSIYLFVSNYYQGNTGTYLLEIAIEKGTFGMDEFKDSEKVTLYPNPASDYVTLSSDNWNEFGLPLNIRISDLTGRSVYTFRDLNPDSGKLDLQLQDLKEGVYYVRLTGQKGSMNKKLVIKK